jgi:hypothetical protein
MVPATGIEPARPAEDFGFKDRCVYHSATRAIAYYWIDNVAVKKNSQPNQVSIKKEQRARFIKAAREAGCSEDEAVFDENLKKIAWHKPPPSTAPEPKKPKTKKLGQ